MTPLARVAVSGPRSIILDLVVHLLADAGFRPADPAHAEVTVLVDPDETRLAASVRADGRLVVVRSTTVLPRHVDDLRRRGVAVVMDAHSTPGQLCQAVAELCNRSIPPDVADGERAVPLTPREREILHSIDQGASVKQTARQLGITPKTVENLQRRLFSKLGVRNRAQAMAHAHALGLLAEGETARR